MSLEKMIVGLTGNVACGKSSVAKYFEEFGASVINADEVTHNLYKKSFSLKYKLVIEFGFCVLNKNLEINRKRLGEIVFNNVKELGRLNEIVWPYVEKEVNTLIDRQPKSMIVVEVPMLFEAEWEKKFDYVIMVSTAKANQIKRLAERGLSKEEAEKRIDAQTPQVLKEKKADYIIRSDSSFDDMKKQTQAVYEDLKRRNPSSISVEQIKKLK